MSRASAALLVAVLVAGCDSTGVEPATPAGVVAATAPIAAVSSYIGETVAPVSLSEPPV